MDTASDRIVQTSDIYSISAQYLIVEKVIGIAADHLMKDGMNALGYDRFSLNFLFQNIVVDYTLCFL